jgi:tetratricopeptide (TPR) repeat protein
MTICRTTGPLAIHATRFRSWPALANELSVAHDRLAAACVFSDLHLGAWKGHWIGRELYTQLGLAFPEQNQPRIGLQAQQIDESRYIGDLTDNEARGDFNTLLSYRLAGEILDRMYQLGRPWIVVLAPDESERWGDENVLLINFLAQGCQDAGCDLVLVFTRGLARLHGSERWDLRWLDTGAQPVAARVPAGTAVSAIPGIIPARFIEEHGVPPDALVLDDGRVVHSPLSRRHPNQPARALLASFLDGPGSLECQWLAAYCFADEVADDEEVGVLFASASHRSGEGGDDVVLKLLDRAKRKTASTELLAWADAQRQSAMLRLRRWTQAADGPIPPDEAHPSVKLLLFLTKAWGLVMTGRAAEAEPYFQRCRDLGSARRDSKFYLYLLNVSALNKLRLGAFNDALQLEQTIERALAAETPTDWHATYINMINQARLYKKVNDLVTCEAYYRKAFAITEGLRSESDLFYTCLCFAQLEERKGRHDEALRCWLRAAIHWLSAPVPEATAPRVVEAITRGPRGEFVEQVSQRLREQLDVAWLRAGRVPAPFEPADRVPCVPSFARVESVAQPELRCALGGDGWAVFVGRDPAPARFDGAEYQELARRVWQLLRILSGHTDLPDACAILTDAQLGSDLPRTLDETVGSAARFGVRTVMFAHRRVELDDRQAAGMWARARVELAPGVAALARTTDRLVVSYKRYRRPLALPPGDADLVQRLTPDSTVESLAVPPVVLTDLETKRVVRVRIQGGNDGA